MNKKTSLISKGEVEKIGENESFISFDETKNRLVCTTHKEALELIVDHLKKSGILKDFSNLRAIAHRVVHGGIEFSKPAQINEALIKQIRKTIPLAPLHNSANLEGIAAMREIAGDVLQIAIFDTAFHQSMPPSSFLYALPKDYYTNLQIRRYGFHGISHHYLSKESARLLKKPLNKCSLITLHLGSGASASAIKNGKSLETSMGFTPLEGLVMGTRCGDLDPGILLYLLNQRHIDGKELEYLLNHQSGLKGLCDSNDMREIILNMKRGDKNSKLAFEIFCKKIKHYIGAYIALLGKVDAIVFSGGIGANSFEVREAVCKNLSILGIRLDKEKNRKGLTSIGKGDIKIFKIRTDEELEMANQCMQFIKNKYITVPTNIYI